MNDNDFKWMDDIPTFRIEPGKIVDVKSSMTPVEGILKHLHDNSFSWVRGDTIVDLNDGEVVDIWSEYDRTISNDVRYIVIGPTSGEFDYVNLAASEIVYLEEHPSRYDQFNELEIYTS